VGAEGCGERRNTKEYEEYEEDKEYEEYKNA
jgi:hypothetical protein